MICSLIQRYHYDTVAIGIGVCAAVVCLWCWGFPQCKACNCRFPVT